MNYLLSFADSRLGGYVRNPRRRLQRQAEAMGIFGDRIRIWTERDLDDDFRERMKKHLVSGSRGYGYWCWKPQVVLQLLREMDDGDVLLYVDAGCHLNPKGIKRLEEYFELAKEHGIVAFQARSMDDSRRFDVTQHFLPDGEWCKGDLLDYFGVRHEQSVTQTGQLGGTAFLVQKDKESVHFFEEFRQLFYDHFELCDDTPSVTENLPGFVENRHDQSVFSLLGKKHGVLSLSCAEYVLVNCYAPESEKRQHNFWTKYWTDLSCFPIWCRHDKGGVRSLFPVWVKNVVHSLTKGMV